MDAATGLAIATIVIVLVFEYTNGFHDASNIIATVIASRAMTPIQAVGLVAVFEFLGPILGGTAVANTIGKFIDVGGLPEVFSLLIILSGVTGAIVWNVATWWIGIPSSSSHALVGGLVGPVVVSAGPSNVVWGFADLVLHGHATGVTKVLLALILSPIVGFWVGFALQRFTGVLLRGARPSLNRNLRRAQIATAAWLAFSHGTNDAQKSMGIITLVLVTGDLIGDFQVPLWVILACASAITMGILSGGWRIVRTVGFGIYKIRPLHALNAQITAAGVIFGAALVGGPVSTTHVVSSSIMGIGASERPRAVRWTKAKEILSTWLITIPGAAAVGIVTWFVVQIFL
ncbi:MAG: inorganic phosphate transporter [Alphaproteobacteria bacterium]